jgi:hypothetical protein
MIRSATHLAGGKRSAARAHSISAERAAKAPGANTSDYGFAALVEFLPERGLV